MDKTKLTTGIKTALQEAGLEQDGYDGSFSKLIANIAIMLAKGDVSDKLPESKKNIQRGLNVSFPSQLTWIREWLNRYARYLHVSESHIVTEALLCYKEIGSNWRERLKDDNDEVLEAINLLRKQISQLRLVPGNEDKPIEKLVEEEYGVSLGEGLLE